MVVTPVRGAAAVPSGGGSPRPLSVQLLGRPKVAWRDGALDIRSRKNRALVCYLAVRGEPVPRSELAELLWGRERLHNVRQSLYALRRQPGADEWLVETAADEVGVVAECDVTAFEDAVNDGAFEAALRVWRAGFLEGWGLDRAPAFTDWCEVERERLETLHRDALSGRIREVEAQQPAEALDLAERLLRLDELDEGAHRAAMRGAYRVHGREAAATRFEGCRRVLRAELGVDPSDETRRLAEAILRGEDVAPPPAADGRTAPPATVRPDLYGREQEWAQLDAAWTAGRTLIVSGPAGVGTSRLVADFVTARGPALQLRGHDGDREVPYAAVARAVEAALQLRPDLAGPPWLRDELSRLAPGTLESTGATRAAGAPEEGRARLRRAVLAVLQGVREEATLVIDDLQRVDAESLDLFVETALAAEPSPGAAPVVLAYREEVRGRSPESAVRRLVEAGALHLRLGGLAPDAVRRLLADLGPVVPADAGLERLARRLHRYTGGNPLFVQETVRDLATRHQSLDPEVSLALPDRVGALLRRRLDELAPSVLRVARALRVTGPDAAPELIAEIVDLSPGELMEALEDLEDARVLDGPRFTHDLLPQAIAAHMPAAVRRVLHGRAGRALEARDGDAEPARIARHWLAADDPDRAAPHLAAAARKALDLYADDEARRRWFEALWASGAVRDGAASLRSEALLGIHELDGSRHRRGHRRRLPRDLPWHQGRNAEGRPGRDRRR